MGPPISLQGLFLLIGQKLLPPGVGKLLVPDCNFQLHYLGSQSPTHFLPLYPSPEVIGKNGLWVRLRRPPRRRVWPF